MLVHVVAEITRMFAVSKKPIVIVDACCQRFGCGPEIKALVEKCGIRFFESGYLKL